MHITTDGIVLRERAIDEFDCVLTLLTRERGIISAYARGAKKPRGTLRVPAELLSYSCFVLFSNRERYSVDKADLDTCLLYTADTAEDVVIPAGKTRTLDLGGKTLTNVSNHTIINKGNLTVTGGGKIDNLTHQRTPLFNDAGATMTVGNVQVDRSKEAGSSATESGGNSYYYILNHGTMIIDGAQVRSNGCYSSLISNGWQSPTQNSGKSNSVMTVKSGSVSVSYTHLDVYKRQPRERRL